MKACIISWTLVLTLTTLTPCVLAATFATELVLLSKTSTSLTVSWTEASGITTATYYVITVDDSSNTRVQTTNITDLTTTNLTVTALQQAKSYTFTLTTYDSDDMMIGSQYTLRVATVYDTWNTKAIIAIAVASFILLVLCIAQLCSMLSNQDKDKERWKKEVLLVKQKQKEEKRKNKTDKSRRTSRTREDVDEVDVPI
ncbi:uncharacterized protein LOC117100382 [Anneissia japonica]|uniref:uncharacterized protein LOC117100382 n=1 Tax=Anneissia japonica TaxID=1529436 RepID=UPI0014258C82|nr:uncharacterized protein LOC117100382 [Anneissia japonica]